MAQLESLEEGKIPYFANWLLGELADIRHESEPARIESGGAVAFLRAT